MAKNAKTQEAVAERPKVQAQPVQKKVPHPEDNWELKDRKYFLVGRKTPLTYTLPSKHTQRYPLMYFDPITGVQKTIRFATNQASPFVEDQKGEVTLQHIVFQDGALVVPKQMQNLQKLLSLYHPGIDTRYTEFKPVEEAKDELVDLELEIVALNGARDIDIEHAEAILRVEQGSGVNELTSKELRRDVLLFAKKNPRLFIDLANDENVQLRNFGIKARENGIIKLSQNQREFLWASNDRKLLTIPYDENPYSALAAWFKTDEGVEVFKMIEKKLS